MASNPNPSPSSNPSPITQLPLEILEQILSVIGDTKGGWRDLIKLSTVCKDWERTIVDSRSLWTRLDDTNIDVTPPGLGQGTWTTSTSTSATWWLGRSYPFPVSLYSTAFNEQVLSLIRVASQRLRTIHISQSNPVIQQQRTPAPLTAPPPPRRNQVQTRVQEQEPSALEPQTFPLLRSLALQGFTSLPPLFLGLSTGNLPSLTNLYIDRCTFDWEHDFGFGFHNNSQPNTISTNSFSGLTSLTIMNPTTPPSRGTVTATSVSLIPVKTFVQSLSGMPNLTYLVLISCLDPVDSSLSVDTHNLPLAFDFDLDPLPLPLPKLSTLIITEKFPFTMKAFQLNCGGYEGLTTPQTDMTVTLAGEYTDFVAFVEDFLFSSAWAGSGLRAGARARYRRVTELGVRMFDTKVTIQGVNDDIEDVTTNHGTGGITQIQSFRKLPLTTSPRPLSDLFLDNPAIPLDHLQALKVSSDIPNYVDDIREFGVRRCGNAGENVGRVKRVHVIWELKGMKEVIDILGPREVTATNDDDKEEEEDEEEARFKGKHSPKLQVPYPNLETFGIVPYLYNLSCIRKLQDALALRKSLLPGGKRLRTLILAKTWSHPNFADHLGELMKGLVGVGVNAGDSDEINVGDGGGLVDNVIFYESSEYRLFDEAEARRWRSGVSSIYDMDDPFD